jgi:hypothetical protein
VPHLISVLPGFPGLSLWRILKRSWKAMAISFSLF